MLKAQGISRALKHARRVLSPPKETWPARIRRFLLPLLLLGGVAIFYWVVDDHYAVRRWLFWRYLSHASAAFFFCLAALSSGQLAVRLILGGRLKAMEHLFVSFACGVYLFALASFLAGIFKLYGQALFFLLPAVLTIVGLPSLWRFLRPLVGKVVLMRRNAKRAPWWNAVVLGMGLIGVLMLYVLILTPDNTQFDARWKHLAIAEDFVASGGVRRYDEGWWFSGRPHFASHIYAWAFMMPRTLLWDRVEVAAHLEFAIFLFTTVFGIGALCRRLLPNIDMRLTWAARFLFSGTFLYDSSLSAGADHIGATYGPAIALVLFRCLHRLTPRNVALLSLLMAGAAITKETVALMLVLVPVVLVSLRFVVTLLQAARRRISRRDLLLALAAPLVAVVVCLALSSPYWLKNWVWHGNPIYPIAGDKFASRPWGEAASYIYKWGYSDYQVKGPAFDKEGILEGLKVMFTFSFVPHDWKMFHGDVPVFGSVFTLLLPALFFFRRTWRTWLVVVWLHLAVFIWFFALPQDRYLQAVAPMMAAVVAVLCARVWRIRGPIVRGSLISLLAFQLIWGGDVYFLQTHSMIHTSPIKKVIELMEGGYKKQWGRRLEFLATRYDKLGKMFPRPAKLLLHEFNRRTGVNVPVVMDFPTYQYGIFYTELGSPRAIYERYKELGVTHVAWHTRKASGYDSLAGDLLFFDFAFNHVQNAKMVSEFTVGAMPVAPPAPGFDDRVIVFSCDQRLPTGLYRVKDLRAPTFGPRRWQYPPPRKPLTRDKIPALAREVPFLAVMDRCKPTFIGSGFGLELAARRKPVPRTGSNTWSLWVRKRQR